MKYETTDTIQARAYAAHAGVGNMLSGASANVGSAADQMYASALEQVLNRGSKTGDQLIGLKMELARLVEKLDGPMPGEGDQAMRSRQSGLIGFANDQQDTIDALLSDCTGLVSRLSGLI